MEDRGESGLDINFVVWNDGNLYEKKSNIEKSREKVELVKDGTRC